MYHHRPVSFTGRANSHGRTMQGSSSSIGLGQNENLLVRRASQHKPSGGSHGSGKKSVLGARSSGASNGLSRTPAGKKNSTTRRRAFGDISNKKGSSGSGRGGFGRDLSAKGQAASSLQKPHAGDVLKPRSVNLLPRPARAQSSQTSRFLVLPEAPRASGAKPAPQVRPAKQQTVRQTRNPPPAATTRMRTRALARAESVPDIELPAGRTWKQQLEHELKHEDDLASTLSLDSILDLDGCPTPREQWEREMELEWERQKDEAGEDERRLEDQLRAMADRDRKETEEGLVRLYETIDDLAIFSDDDGIDLGVSEALGDGRSLSDSSGLDLDSSTDDDDDLLLSI